jgi:S1-C subfamily serine protease
MGEVLAHGRVRRAWLGIVAQTVDLSPGRRGVHVREVQRGSPAFAAGLRPGDLLLRFGGQRLEGMDDLMRHLVPEAIGKRVEVGLVRDGEPGEVQVRLGDAPA